MDNYTAFKSFLDDEEIKYEEDSFDSGDRFLSIPQRIKSGALVNIVTIFSKTKIKVLIVGIANVEDEDKLGAYYELFNSYNLEYAFFKMYVRQNGICVDGDFSLEICDGKFVPKELMGFIASALFSIDKVYRDLMKIQWL